MLASPRNSQFAKGTPNILRILFDESPIGVSTPAKANSKLKLIKVIQIRVKHVGEGPRETYKTSPGIYHEGPYQRASSRPPHCHIATLVQTKLSQEPIASHYDIYSKCKEKEEGTKAGEGEERSKRRRGEIQVTITTMHESVKR